MTKNTSWRRTRDPTRKPMCPSPRTDNLSRLARNLVRWRSQCESTFDARPVPLFSEGLNKILSRYCFSVDISTNRVRSLQLEYTVYENDHKISYDVSEVNGNPFGLQGFRIDTNNPNCPSPACHPPATNCPGVFKQGQPTSGIPHDCPIGSNIGVSLCTG